MRIGVAGSVGLDHLMTFPGKFTDSLVAGSLEKVSLSFLVDGLEVRRGGCAANISFGMANLGLSPVLVAAVGKDWADYDAWLSRHGVDTSHVLVSKEQYTAHFTVTTDTELNQIASFFPVLASRIVTYRKANGPFATIDDLLKVPGIGAGTLSKFKTKLRV